MRDEEQNIYTAAEFDRATHRRRDTAWLAEAGRHEDTRAVLVWQARNLILLGEPPTAPLSRLAELAPGSETYFLGLRGAQSLFAVDLSGLAEAEALALADRVAPGSKFVDLRQVGALLPQDDAAVLAYAKGLLHWHQRHKFCGVCGNTTVAVDAGHVRRCTNPSCATEHYPRTDPATIMLVSDGDHCLLGRKSIWAPGRYSTLAGFLEPGESLEDAVRREVMEETGVRVGKVRYYSSQPWPFPASLMCGFHAQGISREIVLDQDELEDARWFSRAEIARFSEQGMSLPASDAIARRLIDAWLSGRAGNDW